jgi:hypothetical protein
MYENRYEQRNVGNFVNGAGGENLDSGTKDEFIEMEKEVDDKVLKNIENLDTNEVEGRFALLHNITDKLIEDNRYDEAFQLLSKFPVSVRGREGENRNNEFATNQFASVMVDVHNNAFNDIDNIDEKAKLKSIDISLKSLSAIQGEVESDRIPEENGLRMALLHLELNTLNYMHNKRKSFSSKEKNALLENRNFFDTIKKGDFSDETISKVEEIFDEIDTDGFKNQIPDDLKVGENETRMNDQKKIAEIRADIDNKPRNSINETRRYLQQYLELKEGSVEEIELLSAKDLSGEYKTQRDFFNDSRLDNISIAVIPDDLWVKGSQPSESSAKNNLISIKKSYFEAEDPDQIAWMSHELAHCQNFLDSETPEDYNKKMQTFAFDDLENEYTYPNNKVEQYTFGKQFNYLKEQGKSKDEVITMISEYYNKEDLPFFNRLLEDIYN